MTIAIGIAIAMLGCDKPQPCQPDGSCPPPLTCVAGLCKNTLGLQPSGDASADGSGDCPSDVPFGALAEAAHTAYAGELVVVGGHAGRGRCSAAKPVDAYADAATFAPCGGFRTLPPVPGTRYGAMSVGGPDGALWVVGGRRDGGAGLSIPLGDTFRLAAGDANWGIGAADVPARSHGALAATLDPPALWLHGGDIGTQPGVPIATGALRRLDVPTGTERRALAWTLPATSGDAPGARRGHALLGRAGSLVMLGGIGPTGVLPGDVRIYEIATGVWRQVDILSEEPTPRAFSATAWLPDGKVLVFGGRDADWGERNDLWSLDVEAGIYTRLRQGDLGLDNLRDGTIAAPPATCEPPAALLGFSATDPERRAGGGLLVTGGGAWLYGGAGACGALGDVWRYDLAQKAWAIGRTAGPGAACPMRRSGCTTLCEP
ncbi:MAG: hypothetical protein RIT45_4399 [Pseudomonadota bacterium]|jgi:hypothetical protein